MPENDRSFVNPCIVLREEFDEWALLFDPDTNAIFTIDPVALFTWKRLDGRHTVADIVRELRKRCDDAPEDAVAHIDNFIQELIRRGLAGRGSKTGMA